MAGRVEECLRWVWVDKGLYTTMSNYSFVREVLFLEGGGVYVCKLKGGGGGGA